MHVYHAIRTHPTNHAWGVLITNGSKDEHNTLLELLKSAKVVEKTQNANVKSSVLEI